MNEKAIIKQVMSSRSVKINLKKESSLLGRYPANTVSHDNRSRNRIKLDLKNPCIRQCGMTCMLIFLFLTLSFATSGYRRPDVYKIDAEKNAYVHNNIGLTYVDEKAYYAAIQEFKIAISLNPKSQATAVYYNNLGEVYMTVGFPKYAQDCFERAIAQYPLSFIYYQNLAKCYKALNIVDYKIKSYSASSKNPLNMVMLGLLYIEKGNIKRGIIKLDEFCMQEPDLIITSAVRNYLKSIVSDY